MEFKRPIALFLGFAVLVVPMMVLDLVLSPWATWKRLSTAIRREVILQETRHLVRTLEHSLHQRKVDRQEVN